jgi:hypothetical protein
MLSRITLPLLVAAVLVFACGPRTPTAAVTARPSSGAGAAVTSRVSVDTAGGAVRFAIAVTNDTPKRVELNFPDGRTHEFVVLDATGREVWRWSEGRLFTQAVRNRLLDVHDAVVYHDAWPGAAPGDYTLVAELRSVNYPLQQRLSFALR